MASSEKTSLGKNFRANAGRDDAGVQLYSQALDKNENQATRIVTYPPDADGNNLTARDYDFNLNTVTITTTSNPGLKILGVRHSSTITIPIAQASADVQKEAGQLQTELAGMPPGLSHETFQGDPDNPGKIDRASRSWNAPPGKERFEEFLFKAGVVDPGDRNPNPTTGYGHYIKDLPENQQRAIANIQSDYTARLNAITPLGQPATPETWSASSGPQAVVQQERVMSNNTAERTVLHAPDAQGNNTTVRFYDFNDRTVSAYSYDGKNVFPPDSAYIKSHTTVTRFDAADAGVKTELGELQARIKSLSPRIQEETVSNGGKKVEAIAQTDPATGEAASYSFDFLKKTVRSYLLDLTATTRELKSTAQQTADADAAFRPLTPNDPLPAEFSGLFAALGSPPVPTPPEMRSFANYMEGRATAAQANARPAAAESRPAAAKPRPAAGPPL